MPRTRYCWESALEDVAADVEVVLRRASATSSRDRPYLSSLSGSTMTWILLDVPAEGIDLADAGDGLEDRGQGPVLDRPQLGQVGDLVRFAPAGIGPSSVYW